jgi:hypothetical protein
MDQPLDITLLDDIHPWIKTDWLRIAFYPELAAQGLNRLNEKDCFNNQVKQPFSREYSFGFSSFLQGKGVLWL